MAKSQPGAPGDEVLVRFYSGHKRATFPRALVINGLEVLVESIIRHEIIEDLATRNRRHVFVCSVQGQFWEVIRFSDNQVSCRQLDV